MPSVKDFLRSFGGRWFVAMSGPLTVPFAFLALFVPAAWLRVLFGVLAICCAGFSSYWIWAIERKKVMEYESKPPSLDVKIVSLFVQKAEKLPDQDVLTPSINCDVFLHVRIVLDEPSTLELEDYRLTPMLYGNSSPAAWFTGGLNSWGLMTRKQQITDAVSLVSGYRASELPKRLHKRLSPIEGWLHFLMYRVREDDITKMLYRLHVSKGPWTTHVEITGDKNLASDEVRFERLPEKNSTADVFNVSLNQ